MSTTILAALRTIELALGSDGAPPSEFCVFPAGRWQTTKGEFLFDELASRAVLGDAKDYGNDFPVDYEHAMLDFFSSCDPALKGRAAGWIPNAGLELREGALWATGVTWTPDATSKLKSREYRYLSPAFSADGENRVTRFVNIALTNLPATKRMDPLVLDRRNPDPEVHPMKSLLIALGLTETATEAEALAALNARDTKAAAEAGIVRDMVALTGKATASEAIGTATAWKHAAEQVTTLSARVQELEGAGRDRDVTAMVEDATKAGKITPALREWALSMGRKDIAQLKAFIDAAPVHVVATGERVAGDVPMTLSAEEKEVAKNVGITEAAYLERKKSNLLKLAAQ